MGHARSSQRHVHTHLRGSWCVIVGRRLVFSAGTWGRSGGPTSERCQRLLKHKVHLWGRWAGRRGVSIAGYITLKRSTRFHHMVPESYFQWPFRANHNHAPLHTFKSGIKGAKMWELIRRRLQDNQEKSADITAASQISKRITMQQDDNGHF